MPTVSQNEPNLNHRFDVQKNAKLTVDYWKSGGGGGTDLSTAEARRKIVKLLSGMTFGVNAVPVEKRTVVDAAGEATDLTHEVRNSGVTMVLSNAGNTALTYPIRNGAPLCFDMSTGYAVTGINPEWQASEYKIVGMALGDAEDGLQLIPMQFSAPASPGGTVNYMAGLTAPLFKGKSATAVILKPYNSDTASQGAGILEWEFEKEIVVWDYLMPYADDFIEAGTKIIVSQEPHTGLFVLNNLGCMYGGYNTPNGGVSDSPPTSPTPDE